MNNIPTREEEFIKSLSELFKARLNDTDSSKSPADVTEKFSTDFANCVITLVDGNAITGGNNIQKVSDTLDEITETITKLQSLTIVGVGDTYKFSDANVLSSLRTVAEIKNRALSRLEKDSAKEVVTFEKGIEIGDYTTCTGGAFSVNAQGKSVLEVDFLKARLKAIFEVLEVQHTNHIGGKQVISPGGGMKCTKVVKHNTNEIGEELSDGSGFYRCYFLCEQDGVKVENKFQIGDLAQCKEFNVISEVTNESNTRYYWRAVVGIGEDYVDLSIADCDTLSDPPEEGDNICHVGNKTDISRQNVLIFSSVDFDSPSITLLHGINSYSYTNKEYVAFGVDLAANKAYFKVYGDAYIGSRDRSSFLEFTQENGVKIKGKLEVGTQIGNGSTIEGAFAKVLADAATAANENLNNYAELVAGDLGDIQAQIDGQVESWFEEYSPTISSYPASGWTTSELKQAHANDTFTNTTTGGCWRWQLVNGVWEWGIISDTATQQALRAAAKAQDTAEGRRRVFVMQPKNTDAYDIGDLWVNATFGEYSNDMLRCNTSKEVGISFSISHWELASKYTDDTKATEALTIANAAKTAAENAGNAINNIKNFTDVAFSDGVVDRSETATIKSYLNGLGSIQNSVTESYSKMHSSTLLFDSTINPAKTALENTYGLFNTAISDLRNSIDVAIADGIATSVDRATVNSKYEVFNTKYGDFMAALSNAADFIYNNLNNDAVVAKAAADAAQSDVDNLSGVVTNLGTYLDGAFRDGVISDTELNTINGYLKNISSIKEGADNSYSVVYANEVLDTSGGATAKALLGTKYSALTTAIETLTSNIDSVVLDNKVTPEEKSLINTSYAAFNTAYGEFTNAMSGATQFIMKTINDKAEENKTQIAGYDYLKRAFGENTSITGGVVQSSVVSLGYTGEDNVFHVMSGTNGIYDSTKIGGGIAAWYGGPMRDKAEATPEQLLNKDYALGVDRMDGTGYRAGGSLYWGVDGRAHADPLSFFVGEAAVGGLLASFQVVLKEDGEHPDYLIPQVPFQTLQIADYIQIGNIRIVYDNTDGVNALKIIGADDSSANLYTTGGLSALGMGSGGTGGGGLIQTVYGYADLGSTFLDTDKTNTFNAYAIAKLAQRLSSVESGALTSVTWSIINGTPTSLLGYGITDAVASSLFDSCVSVLQAQIDGLSKKNQFNELFATHIASDTISADRFFGKLDWTDLISKPTTLAGYGITDAAPLSHISDAVKHITSTERSNWNTAYTNNHTHSNKSVIDGITSTLVSNWNTAYTNNHTHSNKAALDKITLDVDGNIMIDGNVYATGGLSALGSSGSSGGSGGVVQTVYGYTGLGGTYSDTDLTNTFNAYTINSLANRLTNVENGALTSVDWSIINGRPSALSFFINDSGFVTASIVNGYATQSWVSSNFNNYSLPVATNSILGGVKIGSRISILDGVISADSQTDNNFTTVLKTKLDGIATGANNYILPTATASVLGGIMVGTGLGISSSVLSVSYGTAARTACQGNDSRLSDSRPASDVYAWAKAATKPTYTYTEVGAAAASHTHSYLPLTGGTLTGELTLSISNINADNFIKFKNDNQNCYFGVRNPYGSYGLTFVSPDGTYNKVWHSGNLTNLNQLSNGAGFITASASITGNAATATKLTTARSIAGVSFDGTTNIDIPFANLISKPTTLGGYGITDAVSSEFLDSCVSVLQGQIDNLNKKNQFTELYSEFIAADTLSTDMVTAKTILIGDLKLVYDQANNALKLTKADGSAVNLLVTGGMTCYA